MDLLGADEDHLLVTAISPNLDYEEDVLDLFDAIAGTFTFYDEAAEAELPGA